MTSIEAFKLLTGLIGGLAMFLYGMNIMSDGLTKLAGGKLESMLSKITSKKLIAYLFGVGVTAVVQSSSASTVMVVGLVNSGIMTLKQAVNIILGANLGTTFTAWLLSLNAISSDNFFINLFKPTSFTPFLALIGIAFLMFAKSDKKRITGTVMLGFSVLMFGMTSMSGAVTPLKDIPAFTDLLTKFSNPLLGFLVGVAFTMIIQSSAGTIGVVQALSLSVAISYGVAMPIVIGAEVGTCITAILSSLGANKNGKRTALMHLYFNIIKASTFMIVFYTLNAFLHFAFLQQQAGMVGVASIHTLVNLIGTPLMLPFSGLLVNMAMKTIPTDDAEREEMESTQALQKLDERFLSNPSFALEQSRHVANEMAEMALEALQMAQGLFFQYDDEIARKVVHHEETIDRYEDELGTYLMKINSHHLGEKDSHTLSILLHCITDFERISDHCLNLEQIAKRMKDNDRAFSDDAAEEVKIFSDAVREILTNATNAFIKNDLRVAATVEPLEEVIDGLHMEVKRRHIRRLRTGKCTIDLGFDLSDLGTDFERISDHCSNVAVALLQVNEDGFDTHGYLEMVRQEQNPIFENAVGAYELKYQLPRMKKSEMAEEAPVEESFAEDHPILIDYLAREERALGEDEDDEPVRSTKTSKAAKAEKADKEAKPEKEKKSKKDKKEKKDKKSKKK